MTDPSPLEPPTWRRLAAFVTLGVIAGDSGLTFILAPQYRELVAYGLYAIPAHLLISFLPNAVRPHVLMDI